MSVSLYARLLLKTLLHKSTWEQRPPEAIADSSPPSLQHKGILNEMSGGTQWHSLPRFLNVPSCSECTVKFHTLIKGLSYSTSTFSEEKCFFFTFLPSQVNLEDQNVSSYPSLNHLVLPLMLTSLIDKSMPF